MTGTLRLRWFDARREEPWRIEVLQADPVVEFSDQFLEAFDLTDRLDVSLGDGILTIRGINRTVSYGLGKHDLMRMTTMGYLSA